MEEELKSHLRSVFAVFEAASPLAGTTIWARAVGDARFLDRLESGAGFTVKTYDRAMRWFSDNWPTHSNWPEGVERPGVASPFSETAA